MDRRTVPRSLVGLVLVLAGCITAPADDDADMSRGALPALPPLEDPYDRPTDPDRAWHGLRVDIVSDGRFRVALPVLVYDEDRGHVNQWRDGVDIRSEGEVTVERGMFNGRPVLWADGSGASRIQATLVSVSGEPGQCCAEDFLHATWSTNGIRVASGDPLEFAATEGSGRVSWAFLVASNWCGGDEARFGSFDAHLDAVPTLDNEQPSGMWCA